MKREIIFYKNYFKEFYVAQNEKVRRKIAQTLVWLQTLDRLPVTILKSIEGKKGCQKKTQKTPQSEIDKAEKLMKEYYNEK